MFMLADAVLMKKGPVRRIEGSQDPFHQMEKMALLSVICTISRSWSRSDNEKTAMSKARCSQNVIENQGGI